MSTVSVMRYIPLAVAALLLIPVAFIVLLSLGSSSEPSSRIEGRTGISVSKFCAPGIVERYGLDRMNENQKASDLADGLLATGARITYVVCDPYSHDLAVIGLRGHGNRDLMWRVQDGVLALSSLVSTGR